MRVKGRTNLAMNRGDSESLTINYTDIEGMKLMKVKITISATQPTDGWWFKEI